MVFTTEKLSPRPILLKKLIISFFIIACIWIQCTRNAQFALGASIAVWIVEPLEVREGVLNAIGRSIHPIFQNKVGRRIALHLWQISRFGFFFGQGAGLMSYWRMFTPIPTTLYRNRYYGIYEDGTEVLLPLPYQSERRFIDRFFFDFREAKFQVNMFYFPNSRRQYAKYLCRTYRLSALGKEISYVKHSLQARQLYSPTEARERGMFKAPEMRIEEEVQYSCENSP